MDRHTQVLSCQHERCRVAGLVAKMQSELTGHRASSGSEVRRCSLVTHLPPGPTSWKEQESRCHAHMSGQIPFL